MIRILEGPWVARVDPLGAGFHSFQVMPPERTFRLHTFSLTTVGAGWFLAHAQASRLPTPLLDDYEETAPRGVREAK